MTPLLKTMISIVDLGNDDDGDSVAFGIDLGRGLFVADVCSETKFKQAGGTLMRRMICY